MTVPITDGEGEYLLTIPDTTLSSVFVLANGKSDDALKDAQEMMNITEEETIQMARQIKTYTNQSIESLSLQDSTKEVMYLRVGETERIPFFTASFPVHGVIPVAAEDIELTIEKPGFVNVVERPLTSREFEPLQSGETNVTATYMGKTVSLIIIVR